MTIAGETGLLLLMENSDASCLPCTPEEEKQIITELERESVMQEGDTWYLLSYRWITEWRKYTGQQYDDMEYIDIEDQSVSTSSYSNGIADSNPPPTPGEIDNNHLIIYGTHTDELVKNLQEEEDYVLVSSQVWKKFHDWYKGGPAVPRKVISQGIQHTLTVEVYPLCLQVIDDRHYTNHHVIHISKKASVRELYHQVGVLLGLEMEKICILDYLNKSEAVKLEVLDQTLEEAALVMDQHILVKVETSSSFSVYGTDSTGNGLALVPAEPSRSPISIGGGTNPSNSFSPGLMHNYYGNNYGGNSRTPPTHYSYKDFNLSKTTKEDREDSDDGFTLSKTTKGDRGGLAGLQNLGNTCFMNSALQCLVHTPPLVDYFLQDYSEEINMQNPIGMQGELAIAFGELLRNLWSPGRVPIAPRKFKTKLARFAPQFSGYNQHDSHELLAFLLDGLHEDLNRVKLKPYKELNDANGRPDEDVANECWEIHKARNDSVIVDVCQGQYKSTLVCPVCNKVSVTFDPFMYLSLPLPSRAMRSMTITVFNGDGSSLPMPYTVTVLKHGFLKDLLQVLNTACCLGDDENLLLAEVFSHKIYKYLDPCDPISQVKDEDYIVAYRLPKKPEGYTKLEIIHRVRERNIFGTPLVTYLPEGSQNSTDIQSAVHKVLTPLLKLKPGHPSNSVHNAKEDGYASSLDDEPVETDNIDCEIGEQSLDKMEVDLSYNISLVTYGGSIDDSPIDSDFHFKPDRPMIKVCLDWYERESDMYDIHYLEDLPHVHKPGYTTKKTKQDVITLSACLEAFLKEEPLGPDDMWYCPTCKEHRQATKKLDLWRLPEVLVAHLKRFSYNRWYKNKLDTYVNFPIQNLDLKGYVKNKDSAAESYMYELYAVSNHFGGLGGGHYTAYAKVNEDKWYEFDDGRVSPIKEGEIKTPAAYVLFYRRVPEKVTESPPSPSHSQSSSD